VKRVFGSIWTLLLAVVLIFHVACGGGGEQAAAPASAPESTPPSEPAAPVDRSQMELLEANQSATQTTITIVGRVKNISSREVMGVTVSVNFQDADGNSVRVEQGNLATDPLPPNETSEFRITTAYSANIRRFAVSFAELFGGPLIMKDSRTQ
jgi:hypothetical protein